MSWEGTGLRLAMKVQILENVEEAIGERIYDFIKQISKL